MSISEFYRDAVGKVSMTLGQQITSFRSAIGQFPSDIAVVVVLVALINLSLGLSATDSVAVLLPFELLLVLFLPGYVVVCSLFPRDPDRSTTDTAVAGAEPRPESGVTLPERLGLSVGLSLALVSLVGLVLNVSPYGLGRVPIVASVSGFVMVFALVAAVRRMQVPVQERYSLEIRRRLSDVWTKFFGTGSGIDTVLNVLLVASVLLAVSSVAYAVTVPTPGERHTEFYVLSDDGDGEPAFGDYPQSVGNGTESTLTLGVENHEFEPMTYTVVVAYQTVRERDGERQVVERTEADRLSVRNLAHDDRWTTEYEVDPPAEDGQKRVVFMLYRDGAPNDPTADGAYRSLRLRLNASG